MKAIERTGHIVKGQLMLTNPPPADWEGQYIRAIIMADEPQKTSVNKPLPPPVPVVDVTPLTRDDIYDRS